MEKNVRKFTVKTPILRYLMAINGIQYIMSEDKWKVLNGVLGGIRTHDLMIRNHTLYPAELRGLEH